MAATTYRTCPAERTILSDGKVRRHPQIIDDDETRKTLRSSRVGRVTGFTAISLPSSGTASAEWGCDMVHCQRVDWLIAEERLMPYTVGRNIQRRAAGRGIRWVREAGPHMACWQPVIGPSEAH